MTTPQKKQREYLGEYTRAARIIELSGMVIDVLEQVGTSRAIRAIKLLKAEQQIQLVKLDAAAAKLGAPYPKSQTP